MQSYLSRFRPMFFISVSAPNGERSSYLLLGDGSHLDLHELRTGPLLLSERGTMTPAILPSFSGHSSVLGTHHIHATSENGSVGAL